jgi:SAM-dependent methyltransferase
MKGLHKALLGLCALLVVLALHHVMTRADSVAVVAVTAAPVVAVTAAPVAPSCANAAKCLYVTRALECQPDAVRGATFLGALFCDPGWTGNCCHEAAAKQYAISESSDMGYYSTDAGVARVPKARWRRAQNAEHGVWDGNSGSGDRIEDHLAGFKEYEAISGNLGDIAEVGCGPWTQLGALLDKRKDHVSLKSITLLDPGIEGYLKDVPTVAYKDKKLRGHDVTLLSVGAEALSQTNAFDTVVFINMLEHVEDAFQVLTNTHRALRVGGLLIFAERWWDHYKFETPVSSDGKDGQADHLLHPIRVKRLVLEHFLSHFETLYRVDNHVSFTKYGGRGCYFIGRKIK